MLTPSAVKSFYDRFGARQDSQGFYEDAAVDDLLSHAAMQRSHHIVEFGCGTGRLAERLLHAAPAARYTGCDVSTTMVGLAGKRLAGFGERATVLLQPEGSVSLPVPARSADRVLSTYVLDLLPEAQIEAFLTEARRVLEPGGRICLAGIAPGCTPMSRVVMSGWMMLWRAAPGAVGGCRPITVAAFVRAAGWVPEHVGHVVRWGVASETVVAIAPDQQQRTPLLEEGLP